MVTFLCHHRENENKFVVIDIYADISAVAFRVSQPTGLAGAFLRIRMPFYQATSITSCATLVAAASARVVPMTKCRKGLREKPRLFAITRMYVLLFLRVGIRRNAFLH